MALLSVGALVDGAVGNGGLSFKPGDALSIPETFFADVEEGTGAREEGASPTCSLFFSLLVAEGASVSTGRDGGSELLMERAGCGSTWSALSRKHFLQRFLRNTWPSKPLQTISVEVFREGSDAELALEGEEAAVAAA